MRVVAAPSGWGGDVQRAEASLSPALTSLGSGAGASRVLDAVCKCVCRLLMDGRRSGGVARGREGPALAAKGIVLAA